MERDEVFLPPLVPQKEKQQYEHLLVNLLMIKLNLQLRVSWGKIFESKNEHISFRQAEGSMKDGENICVPLN